jgi:hypothetical protein
VIDQALWQKSLASQAEQPQQQAQFWMVTLWSQLEPERQIQLAQRLAELIQRMRKAPYREENDHEGA